MKRFKAYREILVMGFSLLMVLTIAVSTAIAGGEGTALVIIDMQPRFVTRNRNHGTDENQAKVDQIIDSQVVAIQKAKELGLPIVVVEYENYGDTNAALKKAIGDYKRVRYFQKDRDGMFDPRNSFRGPLMEHLKEQDIGTLLITGANGGACVKRSIRGALENDYQVIAYAEGIADFNFKEFIYPYKYKKDQIDVTCAKCTFREVSGADQIMRAIMGKGWIARPMIEGSGVGAKGSR